MSTLASQFQGMVASVVTSQSTEVILGKQPVLSAYGREVRTVLNTLPPEVSRDLTRAYRAPVLELLARIEGAIAARELAIESTGREAALDKEWLAAGGEGRNIEERNLGTDDPWAGTTTP